MKRIEGDKLQYRRTRALNLQSYHKFKSIIFSDNPNESVSATPTITDNEQGRGIKFIAEFPFSRSFKVIKCILVDDKDYVLYEHNEIRYLVNGDVFKITFELSYEI